MGLQAPIKINLDGIDLLMQENEFEYNDPDFTQGMQLHATVSKLFIIPPPQFDENGNIIKRHIAMTLMTDIEATNYIKVKRLISSCVENAESILNKLKIPNAKIYKESPDYKGESDTYSIVKVFDFMKLKDKFVEYLKTNERYSHLGVYGKTAGKPLRIELNLFVLYRNIFTHGKLMIMANDNTYCIEYLDDVTKELSYMPINPKIINDFNEAHKKFLDLINAYVGLLKQ